MHSKLQGCISALVTLGCINTTAGGDATDSRHSNLMQDREVRDGADFSDRALQPDGLTAQQREFISGLFEAGCQMKVALRGAYFRLLSQGGDGYLMFYFRHISMESEWLISRRHSGKRRGTSDPGACSLLWRR